MQTCQEFFDKKFNYIITIYFLSILNFLYIVFCKKSGIRFISFIRFIHTTYRGPKYLCDNVTNIKLIPLLK